MDISVSGPIYPVMDSCCLSAGNVRFLILPVPTEEFSFPYGWLTSGIDHPLDLIGIATFRMCEMQLGRMSSLLRELGIFSCDFCAHKEAQDHVSCYEAQSRGLDMQKARYMARVAGNLPERSGMKGMSRLLCGKASGNPSLV